MLASRFTRRTFPIGALAATILLWSVPGHGASKRAKKAKNACAAAHTRAQAREKAGKLREAREVFSTCAAAQCGRAIKKDCAARYAQLETEIPSIIPVLVDDPRKDVQVSVDGEILTSRLDGRPLSIDPGAHDLTFSAEGEVFAASRFTIARSERGRRISGDGLESETPAQATRPEPPKGKERASEEPSTDEAKEPAHEAEGEAPAIAVESKKPGAPALAYVLGGVGLAGVGAGILLNGWGRKDNSDLQANCMPYCPQASVDHVHKIYFAADVSFGVGAVALGVATVLFVLPRHAKENPESRTAYTVDVVPTPSGGFATLSGKF